MQFARARMMLVTAALAAALLFPLLGPGLSAFTDLGGYWAASAIAALNVRGLVAGYPDGSFAPEQALTRAELAKLMAVLLGQGDDARALAGVATRFPDVPGSYWAAGYVESLAELRLLRGDTDGNFHPDRTVTRAEFAVILARAARLENTPDDAAALRYWDLAAVPDWARGAVGADTGAGLLTGDGTGLFRPRDGVQRAEAAAAMLRLLAYRGEAFQVVGEFLAYAPANSAITLRDAMGRVQTVTLARDAVIFRQGRPATAADLLAADQVWVYLGSNGQAHYVDARFRANWGTRAQVSGNQVSFLRNDGTMQTLPVQSTAQVFLNGRPAALADVNGAQRVYVSVDVTTGAARQVDAVRFRGSGTVRGVDPQQQRVTVEDNGQWLTYTAAGDTVIFRNGVRAGLKDLVPGDVVLLQFDDARKLSYLQADRQPG